MTGGPRSRPVADGGTHTALFEAFPDPLLVYAGGVGAAEHESDGNESGEDANESHVHTDEGGDASGRGADAAGGAVVVRRVNPAFEATFGLGTHEVTGIPLEEVVLAGDVDPDRDATGTTGNTDDVGPSPTATARSLLDRVRGEGGAAGFEYEDGGGTRHFRVRTVAAERDEGAAGGYLLFTDVTESERQRRDLEATVARLERVASVASHDIRNPLEVAGIRLEAARDTGEDVHFEKVAGALDRIERIVRDVLAAGGGGVDPTDEVALGAVVRAAWETVDTADATLVNSPGLPTVRGDADRLRGLFENLFRNAVEHGVRRAPARDARGDADERDSTSPHSGTHEDSVEHGGEGVTVTVEPLADGFAVVDDGPGVPEEARERAFEVGYSTAPDNSGLGLSIVKRVAEEHGWEVALAGDPRTPSDADAGARFEFTGVDRLGSEDATGGRGDRAGPDSSG